MTPLSKGLQMLWDSVTDINPSSPMVFDFYRNHNMNALGAYMVLSGEDKRIALKIADLCLDAMTEINNLAQEKLK